MAEENNLPYIKKFIAKLEDQDVQKAFSGIEGIAADMKFVQEKWEDRYGAAAQGKKEGILKATAEGNLWLCGGREWAYEVEELFESILSKGMKAEKTKRAANSNNGVRYTTRQSVDNMVEECFTSVSTDLQIAEKASLLKKRYEEIYKDICEQTKDNARADAKKKRESPTGSIIANGARIFGRDRQLRKLVDELRRTRDGADRGSDSSLSVVAVVGMRGVGKTVLAEHAFQIFKDENPEKCFEVQGWMCAGEDSNAPSLTRAAVQSLDRNHPFVMPSLARAPSDNDLELFQGTLREIVEGKKFLLVVDGIWDVDCNEWETFIKPLTYGAEGSKILVTTHNRRLADYLRVPEMVKDVIELELGVLSADAGWDYFKSIAFANTDLMDNSELEKQGKDIVRKCCFLPSAIKTLARYLRKDRSPEKKQEWDEKWKAALDNDIKDLGEYICGQVLEFFLRSYQRLPHHLKTCFRYCALFPQNHRISRGDFIRLLIANDLIDGDDAPESKTRRSLERKGMQYIDDLVSWSFFKPSEPDMKKPVEENYLFDDSFGVLLELARHHTVTGHEFQRMSGKLSEIHDKTRHLAICISSEMSGEKIVPVCVKNSSIRSLLVMLKEPRAEASIDVKIQKHGEGLQRLRALDLSGSESDTEVLKDCVCSLTHLRYLKLKITKVKKLPEYIFDLHNLQALDLGSACNLVELPDLFRNLPYLRYLRMTDTKIKELPESIFNLQNLQSLDLGFACNLEELPDLFDKLHNLLYLNFRGTKIRQFPRTLREHPRFAATLTTPSADDDLVTGRIAQISLADL